jgi:hypothetical protein
VYVCASLTLPEFSLGSQGFVCVCVVVQKHDIPVSAIPCLKYQRALEREKECLAKASENGLPEDGNTSIPASDGCPGTLDFSNI